MRCSIGRLQWQVGAKAPNQSGIYPPLKRGVTLSWRRSVCRICNSTRGGEMQFRRTKLLVVEDALYVEFAIRPRLAKCNFAVQSRLGHGTTHQKCPGPLSLICITSWNQKSVEE